MNPMQADYVQSVNDVFWGIMGLSIVLLVAITAAMIYFMFRYHHTRHPKAVQIEGSLVAETLWTVIPTILVLGMFYYGYEGWALMRAVPPDAMTVQVTGRMWDWSYEYENGTKTTQLFVPSGKPVKLELHSLDVIHSFYIPQYRIKEDVVPGYKNYMWFLPRDEGPVQVFCAEYCGQRHSYMLSRVHVMKPAEFEQWYASKGDEQHLPPWARAYAVFDRYQCTTCHDLNGTEALGLKGIFGTTRKVERAPGQVVDMVADEAYLRRAITHPEAELLEGYEIGEMPAPANLAPADLDFMIEYLKTKGQG
jgi:cytochrome c oxidase subunit II